jgi:tetratricopeptide (TPR) repeat protein
MFMAHDWYRKTSWSEADQADFFARLKRSRTPYNKAQYLRVQAYYLEGVGSPELLKVSLTLLDKMLGEFPEKTQLASAYGQKASCLAKLGEIDQATTNYQRALETEREFPNVKTDAFIKFGKLVVENKLTQFFDEALVALQEFKSRGIRFPRDIFHAFVILSIIAAQRGEAEKAEEFAKVALEAADKVHSELRYHSTVGLVRDKETPFYKSVQAIALN